VRSWQTRLRRLFKLANTPDGHAHRFRDTFAVELLLAGVPIERVSILLGHQSVRTTEKHYAPSVRSRQEQLEVDLARAWNRTHSSCPTARYTRVHRRRRFGNSSNFNRKEWCPGWESNPHEEKSPEDFKSSASAIPPPGRLADINVTEAAGWGKAACHEIETRKAASLRSEHGTVGSLFRESCASTD
jgi:Phage integrase family